MSEHSDEHPLLVGTDQHFGGEALVPGGICEYCCMYRVFDRGRYFLRSSITRDALAARHSIMEAAGSAYAGEFRVRLWTRDAVRVIYARLADVMEWDVSEAMLPKQFEASCWQADLERRVGLEISRVEVRRVLARVRERGHATGSRLRSFAQQFERICERSGRELGH